MARPEYELYNIVSAEVRSKNFVEPIWQKALAAAEGDQQKALARYMQYRLDELKHEDELNSPPLELETLPEASSRQGMAGGYGAAGNKTAGGAENTNRTGGARLAEEQWSNSDAGDDEVEMASDPAPWARWMAKMVDLSIYNVLLGIPMVYLFFSFMTFFTPSNLNFKPYLESETTQTQTQTQTQGQGQGQFDFSQFSDAELENYLNNNYGDDADGSDVWSGGGSQRGADRLNADDMAFAGLLMTGLLKPFIWASLITACLGIMLGLILDAVVLGMAGTSVGRILMEITIQAPRRASFVTALIRNMKCFVRGFLLGIPLLAGITMAVQYSVVARGDQTSWDRDTGYQVSYGDAGGLRWLIALVLLLVLGKLSSFLSQLVSIDLWIQFFARIGMSQQ